MARRLHRATVAFTQVGPAVRTATVVLPAGCTIEVASVAAVAQTTGGTDVAWSISDSAGVALLVYAFDPADPALSYTSEEARPVPVGGACTVRVWLDAGASGTSGTATVILDYSTED